MKRRFVILVIVCAFFACERHLTDPSTELTSDFLKSTPDTLRIANQSFILKTELNRDFMPISPPNGRPLTAFIKIETTDSSVIKNVKSDRIYIVNENEVWASSYAEELPPDYPSRAPFRIIKIARNGPKWGPNIHVDVVVRLKALDSLYYLRAPRQYIGQTW